MEDICEITNYCIKMHILLDSSAVNIAFFRYDSVHSSSASAKQKVLYRVVQRIRERECYRST